MRIEDKTVLPCGCKIWREIVDGERQVILDTCSEGMNCVHVKNALGLAEEQNKSVEVRER